MWRSGRFWTRFPVRWDTDTTDINVQRRRINNDEHTYGKIRHGNVKREPRIKSIHALRLVHCDAPDGRPTHLALCDANNVTNEIIVNLSDLTLEHMSVHRNETYALQQWPTSEERGGGLKNFVFLLIWRPESPKFNIIQGREHRRVYSKWTGQCTK